MLTDFNHLCNQKPIVEAIDQRYKVKIESFTQALNHHIHGYGSIGYDKAETFNLKISSRYTCEEAQELLRQIERTRKLPKLAIYISNIDEIPIGMAYLLARDTGSGSQTISEATNTDIKIGALHGDELVGFTSGNKKGPRIVIGGLYISNEYRGNNLSTKLLRCMMNMADREGLVGIAMDNASWAGLGAMRALCRQYEKEDNKNIAYEEFDEDFRKYCDVFFKDRMEAFRRNQK